MRWIIGACALTACTGVIEGEDTGSDAVEVLETYEGGGWTKDACREDIVATGYHPGEVAPDFALQDQFGEEVHLHDFCDHTVLLQIGAFWCGPCMEEAATLESLYTEHKDTGFFPMSVSAYNQEGTGDATVPDLMEWAETYGLSTPVLADPMFAATTDYMAQGNGLPHRVLIDRGMVVRFIGTYSDAQITEALATGGTP